MAQCATLSVFVLHEKSQLVEGVSTALIKSSTFTQIQKPVWTQASFSRLNPYFILITFPFLVVLTMVAGDALVFSWRPDWFPAHIWALLDAPVHVLLALLVVFPLYTRRAAPARMIRRFALASIAPFLIDLDHFIAAGSLSLYSATTLASGRPAAHSLLFALGLGLIAYLFSQDIGDGYLLFAVLASHVVRDASVGGTPFFLWPFSFDQLSLPVYYVAQLNLFCIAQILAWMPARGVLTRSRRMTVKPGAATLAKSQQMAVKPSGSIEMRPRGPAAPASGKT